MDELGMGFIVFLIGVTVALGGLLIWALARFFFPWFNRAAKAALRDTYGEVTVSAEPGPGLVLVVFHTYHGFIIEWTQTEHRFWASPDDARSVLWRLHQFNLFWGIFTKFSLLIQLLSYGNYLAQKRSIRKQTEQLSNESNGEYHQPKSYDL